MIGQGADIAAPGRAGRVQRARDRDGLAFQHDRAAVLVGRRDRDMTTGIDDLVHDHARRQGAELDPAAVGENRAVVFDQRGVRPEAELDQPVTGEVEGKGLAGSERHPAKAGIDHAVVAHAGGHKGPEAGPGDVDLARCDDRPPGRAGEFQPLVAGHETIDVHLAGRGDKAADVDARRGREQHAIRVEDDDDTVGGQRAMDLAGHATTGNTVDGDRGRVGLVEIDRGVRADVEAAPIDDDPIRPLGHVQVRTRGAEAGTAGDHGRVLWQHIRSRRAGGLGEGHRPRQGNQGDRRSRHHQGGPLASEGGGGGSGAICVTRAHGRLQIPIAPGVGVHV